MAEEVHIVRDTWGIPHIFAATEAGAYFGLGYAQAEDRFFQMTLNRRVAQGRISEVLGPGPMGQDGRPRNDSFVDSDRKYRILGLSRKAQELEAGLSPEAREWLQAYADGVNRYAAENKDDLNPLFARYGVPIEPWTVADGIAVWSRLFDRFTWPFGWKNEYVAWRKSGLEVNSEGVEQKMRTARRPPMDSQVAIVPEDEFAARDPGLHARLKGKTKSAIAASGPASAPADFVPIPEPSSSHNWVVTGSRSASGKPLLESDPHYGVIAPAFWHEFHISGGRLNARGMGVPGTPGFLIGWNEKVAWGCTALGGDHIDLFLERVNPADPDQYRFKEEWESFTTREETIEVKGGDPVVLEVRSSRHGPIVNDLLESVPEGEIFAMKYTLLEEEKASIEAALHWPLAAGWESLRGTLREYSGPPLHLLFADSDGNIAYQPAVRTPKRILERTLPRPGWTGEDEWEEMIPFNELPFLLNPTRETIHTANHLAAGDWYPYLLTTIMGDGGRSRRLGELMNEDRRWTADDFEKLIHIDAVNSEVRDLKTLALAAIEMDGASNEEAAEAAALLREWDGRFYVDSPAYPLALGILETLGANSLAPLGLAQTYPAGWGGICQYLRERIEEYQATGTIPPKTRQWAVNVMVKGWKRRGFGQQETDATGYMPQEANGRDADAAEERAAAPKGIVRHMRYMDAAEGFGSLAPGFDLDSPPLRCPPSMTLWSQEGGSYAQIVDLGDIDKSLSMLPPGNVEDAGSAHFTDQMEYWEKGTFHAAPLSRAAVEAIKTREIRLRYGKRR